MTDLTPSFVIARVKRLRHQGKSLSDREIGAVVAAVGEVLVYGVRSSIVDNVSYPNSQVDDHQLLTLYNARLTTMTGLGMLFKGEEGQNDDEGLAYVQEWAIRTSE